MVEPGPSQVGPPARRWLLHLGLPLAVGGALAWLLYAASSWSSAWLSSRGVALEPFASIQCPSPPGLTRAELLEQVQYQGSLPDQINILAPDIESRVRRAFLGHPWVREVTALELRRGQLRVGLLFREPVLFVRSSGRAADREGSLLPHGAPLSGLLTWSGAPERVLPEMSAIAGALNGHRKALHLEGAEMEWAGGEVRIRPLEGEVIRWGPPGKIDVKLRRLLAGERDLHGGGR